MGTSHRTANMVRSRNAGLLPPVAAVSWRPAAPPYAAACNEYAFTLRTAVLRSVAAVSRLPHTAPCCLLRLPHCACVWFSGVSNGWVCERTVVRCRKNRCEKPQQRRGKTQRHVLTVSRLFADGCFWNSAERCFAFFSRSLSLCVSTPPYSPFWSTMAPPSSQ